jgi:hypothetical protein
VCGFDDQFGEHSDVCGFDDQFGEHSKLCGFDDQFGEYSEVSGFTNQFGQHFPSLSLGHISVFPPGQECLTRAMLFDPRGLEALNRCLTPDYKPVSVSIRDSAKEINVWVLSFCRFSQHRHIQIAAKHKATVCLSGQLNTNRVPDCVDVDTCNPSW